VGSNKEILEGLRNKRKPPEPTQEDGVVVVMPGLIDKKQLSEPISEEVRIPKPSELYRGKDGKLRWKSNYKLVSQETLNAMKARKKAKQRLKQSGKAKIPAGYGRKFEDFNELQLSKLEKSTVQELIKRTVKSNHEHGAAIIDSDGNVKFFTSNKYDTVDIPPEISAMLDNPTNSITLLHSHPDNTLPSNKDFSYLLRKGVGKIIVAGEGGNTYSVSVGNGDIPTPDEFRVDVRKIEIDITDDIIDLPEYSEYSVEERRYVRIYEKAFQIKQKYEWDMQGGNINE
jgi:proteasome lid subunit RPN8/RPN11